MGIGMVLVVDAASAESVQARLREAGERPVTIGHVERGARRVRYTGGDTVS
jgi:phosphoribosylaminoimidazole (AIR) synthetase